MTSIAPSPAVSHLSRETHLFFCGYRSVFATSSEFSYLPFVILASCLECAIMNQEIQRK